MDTHYRNVMPANVHLYSPAWQVNQAIILHIMQNNALITGEINNA